MGLCNVKFSARDPIGERVHTLDGNAGNDSTKVATMYVCVDASDCIVYW